MNILLTGASSFTGYWFARTLAERGHSVYATFQGAEAEYQGTRRRRIDALPDSVVRLWNSSLNAEHLLEATAQVPQWDLLCLHGAYVTGYRDPGFDVAYALKNNTDGLPRLLQHLTERGLRRIVATGSVFEASEGAGEEPLRAFSSYGLSKSITWQVQQFWAQSLGLHLGKFVISNPFGPLEEPRFTAYLMKTWVAGKQAEVRTPDYIRDNIHVSRLACHYADFALSLEGAAGTSRCAPMGYVESQGAFTLRFAAAMRERLGMECAVTLGEQKDFSEPWMRVNTQAIPFSADQWLESKAWDELAAYYRAEYAVPNTI
jgi:nucleoside-diphosphate-sugar epimerase